MANFADWDCATCWPLFDGYPADRTAHETLIDRTSPPRSVPRMMAPARPVVRGPFVSVQVNISEFGRNILGDAANEPSLAVDPGNPNHLAIGWRQFDTIDSDFRQAGYAYSQDGGATWTFPGVLSPGGFGSDPVLRSDGDGVFYYVSIADPFDGYWRINRSFDWGMTWELIFESDGWIDKPWIEIDRTESIGRGHLYLTHNGYQGLARSLDTGLSFLDGAYVVYFSGIGTIAVGADGTVYAIDGSGDVIRSDNARDAAVPISATMTATRVLEGSARTGGPNPDGLLGQPWIAVDTSGGPYHGRVYACGSVKVTPGSDPLDVMFASSDDRGVTWTTPVRVNDDPVGTNAYQWFGTMSVAPNGRIDVIWNDMRDNPTGRFSALHYNFSMDGGTTWARNTPVTPNFDYSYGYPANNDKLGDYYDMHSLDNGVLVAYAATFRGEQDVYLLRINRDMDDNDVEDWFDIQSGEPDCNHNGFIDSFESEGLPPLFDFNGDLVVSLPDLTGFTSCLVIQNLIGESDDFCLCLFDVDGDNLVCLADFAAFQRAFGSSAGD